MNGEAIIAENLTKRFGNFTAVDNISFTVRKGEIFGFLGPNGSGKTTTIRMILGLLRPSSGRIIVLGHDAARETAAIRCRAGYMSQKFSLYPELTVAENLRFFGVTYGLDDKRLLARQRDVLRLIGLAGHENRLTRNLPGGWKQRLALGAALLHEPEILFLDEPTAGVDPVSRREFWDLLYDLAAQGTTIFVTTHYMDEAEHCHHLALIYQGRIIAQGTPHLLRETTLLGDVWGVDCDKPEAALSLLRKAIERGELPATDVVLYGSLLHILVPSRAAVEAQASSLLAAQGIHVREITPITPPLEDVFVFLIKQLAT